MIEEAVYALAKAHAGLAGLIGADPNMRIFPTAEERKHPLPCLVFEKSDPDPVAGIHQDSGWYHTHITFTARGQTALQAKQLIVQVRDCFQRFHGSSSGHAIDDVKATGAGDEYFDHELDCYAEEVEFEFFHN